VIFSTSDQALIAPLAERRSGSRIIRLTTVEKQMHSKSNKSPQIARATMQAIGASARAARPPLKVAMWAAIKRKEITGRMVDAALIYPACGYPVFPCGPDDKPLFAGGPKRATTDEAIISAWWALFPHAQIGMPNEHLPS
jgi:hypothetical protein